MTGWITYAPEEGSFQRMRYTGGGLQAPRATEARENGVLLRFAEPLEKSAASDVSCFFAQQWIGLQLAQKKLRAKAGERLSLRFENPDAMPHNWVLVKLGAVERVGDLATRLITESDAATCHYVPDSPDVLAHTRTLDPQQVTTIHFTAPAQPGRYPYICTFPGHWMLMRGELAVE